MAALRDQGARRPIKTSYKTKNLTVPARILYVTGIANKKLNSERNFYPFANLRKLLYERGLGTEFFSANVDNCVEMEWTLKRQLCRLRPGWDFSFTTTAAAGNRRLIETANPSAVRSLPKGLLLLPMTFFY